MTKDCFHVIPPMVAADHAAFFRLAKGKSQESDIMRAKRDGKPAIMLGVEGGKRLSRGVRVLTGTGS
jgi:hypothetical protein